MSALLLIAALLAGAADETATVRGRILRPDGQPLSRAEVRLISLDRPDLTRSAITDERGHYELATVPEGRYRLTARKTGYVTLELGQRQPFEAGEPIQLEPGETRERVDMTLPRHGAITGRVVDENGEPLEGISITVKQAQSAGGGLQLVAVPGLAARRTNDLGRFRLYGLQPGDYVVTAQAGAVGTDDLPGYALTYFPGTINPTEAQRVRLGLGEEVSNVEFSLVPVRTARIAGRTLTSLGEPFLGGIQMRPSRRSTGATAESVGARTHPDGSFEFPNVSPGEYVIQAFKGTEIGWQFVTVNGTDVTDLAVTTLPGSRIAGRITFDGAIAPTRRGLEIAPMPADPDLAPFFETPGSADIHDDWTFEITNVSGPRRLRVRTPAGWALKRVLLGASDVTDAVLPFGTARESLEDVDVMLTSEITRVSGPVIDARGAPVIDATAVIFSTDPDRWYEGSRFVASSRPTDGRFALEGLPPDDYFLVAFERVPERDGWLDPAFLRGLAARAVRVTLTEGQPITVSLKSSGR